MSLWFPLLRLRYNSQYSHRPGYDYYHNGLALLPVSLALSAEFSLIPGRKVHNIFTISRHHLNHEVLVRSGKSWHEQLSASYWPFAWFLIDVANNCLRWNISVMDYLARIAALHNITKGNLYIDRSFLCRILHIWYSFKINVRFIFSHLLKRLFERNCWNFYVEHLHKSNKSTLLSERPIENDKLQIYIKKEDFKKFKIYWVVLAVSCLRNHRLLYKTHLFCSFVRKLQNDPS